MNRLRVVRIAKRARVAAVAGAALLLMITAPANAGSILFLGDLDGDASGDGSNAANAAADQAMIAHLAALGHAVTALDDSVAVPADQAGKDLIVISSTVGSSNARNALVGAASNFQTVSLPIINMEPGLGDEMGLNVVAAQGQFNAASLMITAAGAAHPIGSGVGAGLQTVYTSSVEQLYWYYLNFSYPGYPVYSGAPGASTLAVDDGTGPFGPNNTAGIAVIEPGGLAGYGGHVLNKRIGLFVGNGAFDDLTPVGLQLFDNAIAYGIPEPATMTLLALGAAMLMKRGRRA
jgi:hypothetical protein